MPFVVVILVSEAAEVWEQGWTSLIASHQRTAFGDARMIRSLSSSADVESSWRKVESMSVDARWMPC
jgi:hypothetical protein